MALPSLVFVVTVSSGNAVGPRKGPPRYGGPFVFLILIYQCMSEKNKVEQKKDNQKEIPYFPTPKKDGCALILIVFLTISLIISAIEYFIK